VLGDDTEAERVRARRVRLLLMAETVAKTAVRLSKYKYKFLFLQASNIRSSYGKQNLVTSVWISSGKPPRGYSNTFSGISRPEKGTRNTKPSSNIFLVAAITSVKNAGHTSIGCVCKGGCVYVCAYVCARAVVCVCVCVCVCV
jgi:hypothetical protein